MTTPALSRVRAATPAPSIVALTALLVLATSSITRLGLLAWTANEVPWSLWPGIFARGLYFDLATLGFALPLVLLYQALLPNRLRRSQLHRLARVLWLWLLLAGALFIALAEATFWQEFSTRFNFIAVDYLIYTHEVIGNIRESYPLGWLLTAIVLLAGGLLRALRKHLASLDQRATNGHARLAMLAVAVLLPLLSYRIADLDQMRWSGNAFADELSGNGVFTFAAAARRNDLSYTRFYATLPQAQADAILANLGLRRTPLAASEQPPSTPMPAIATPFRRPPKNLVLISVESLSARFLGRYGNNANLTPHLDRLAAQGLVFERVFATGTRTVRGLEALSLGIPPLPGQSVVRRPGNDHLLTLGSVLAQQGITPYFIYGGYGYFDNMNGYFRGNGYRVIDRTDFPAASIPYENIWGVADEALYDNALRQLDHDAANNQAFFAHVMTTSNHRPFTYPDGRIDIPSPGEREGAVKYTDYAIGRFIAQARAKPWFKDTLFVIVADHCSSVAGRVQLPVEKYHIPLILYAPDLLAAGVNDRLMSQIDIVPTLLDAMGSTGGDAFFGRSIWRTSANDERAFIANYQELGYLKHNVLTVLAPKQRVEAFAVDPLSYDSTPIAVDPTLRDEAIAWYQTSAVAFSQGALRFPASAEPITP